MKETLIKILAYIILIFGLILTLAVLAGAVVLLFVYLPEAVLWKKIALAIAGLIVSAIGLLVSLGIFEYLQAFLKLEEEVEEIEEEVEEEIGEKAER